MTKLYDVEPGFDWVAGAKVPDSRQVRLTAKAAEFDLLQGRIKPVPEEAASAAEDDSVTDPAPLPAASVADPPAPSRAVRQR